MYKFELLANLVLRYMILYPTCNWFLDGNLFNVHVFVLFSCLFCEILILGDNDRTRSWLPQTTAKCAAEGWLHNVCCVCLIFMN